MPSLLLVALQFVRSMPTDWKRAPYPSQEILSSDRLSYAAKYACLQSLQLDVLQEKKDLDAVINEQVTP